MYQLVQNFNTLAELQAFVALIGAVPNGQAAVQAGGKPAKAAATTPSPSTANPSPAAASPPAPAVKEKTYEQTPIADMLKKAIETGKKAAAVTLLAKFNATKDGKPSGQGLKPEQFDEFEAELKAILETEDSIA